MSIHIRHMMPMLLCLVYTAASASPKEDVTRLLSKSMPATVIFSDGTSTWKTEGTSVSSLGANRAVIVHSKGLALDTDGASKEIRACDSTAQPDTALSDAKGRPTDANSIPYFVLPWCGEAADKQKCKKNPPYAQLGLQKGDLAAVISEEKIAFAIAADVGPEKKFGEGSVQLHRQLGHETVGKNSKNPKCAANVSMTSEVFLVIFPKSNNKWLAKEEIEKQGSKLWELLLADENKK